MTRCQTDFWSAVEVAQERILVGDTASALQALQDARNATVSADRKSKAHRVKLLNALAHLIDPNQVLISPETSAPPGGQGDQRSRKHDTDPARTDLAPLQRILVSGIGRSGTTLIYQQLAKLLLLDSRKVNFRYEPYLWNIRTPTGEGNPFDMSQLHHFGLMTHASTPLFLDGPDAAHDLFVDHLFNEPWDQDPTQDADTYLTKVIRGSGRLRSYLKRYPDLKIVGCLRNPLDTINSSLGMFSFFGEEFHSDDRSRFRTERAAKGADVSQLAAPKLSIEWYATWWQAFTEETLAVAEEYPDNVMLFCYEAFQQKPDDMLETLMRFVGIHNIGMFMGLGKPAGTQIKATSLTQHDIYVLEPQIAYYTDKVIKPRLGPQAATAHKNSVVSRYLGSRFSFPIAGSDIGCRSPIQLRGMMLKSVKSPFMSLVQRAAHPISLDELIARHHPKGPDQLRNPATAGDTLKAGKTFGVVITCYNNAATIVDAVLSCLNQTLPFDEIVVVDDKSTDGSAQLLSELGNRYSRLKIRNLPSNLGPSAARDLGIRQLKTDFFTQLDGDDLFWPTKNAQEAKAVSGDERAVAFSDILMVRPGANAVQTTAAYSARTGAWVWQALLSRTPQIPRDVTASRHSYFEAGGYDMTRHLYEDWDFKLRLAMATKTWIRADGLAGTIYNRLSPGLSGADDDEHARALSQIFLTTLRNATDMPATTILTAYDAAIGRFDTQDVASHSRQVLETCLAQGGALTDLSDLVMRRDMRAIDNGSYSQSLDAFARTIQQAKAGA